MLHIRLCNAIITICVVCVMCSFMLVEKQPWVLIVSVIAGLTAIMAQDSKTIFINHLRSSADEDRPE